MPERSKNQCPSPLPPYYSSRSSSSSPSFSSRRKRRLHPSADPVTELWRHCEKLKINNEDKARCNYCDTILWAKSPDDVYHMQTHVNICRHWLGVRVAAGQVTACACDQKEARKQLAYMVILHGHLPTIVDDIGFRRYTNSLQPCFQIPRREVLIGHIQQICKDEKYNNIKWLEGIGSRVSISSHLWRDEHGPFIAARAHFVDSSWVLNSRTIWYFDLDCDESDSLAEDLLDCLDEWKLTEKLLTITLKDSTTTNAMMPFVKYGLASSGSLWRNGEFLHLRCCSRMLNAIMKCGTDVIRDEIGRIRDSMVYWTMTREKVVQFSEIAKDSPKYLSRSLCVDCPTRWNSTYSMLEAALCYEDVFPRLKICDPEYESLPSEAEWELANKVCEIMKLFHSAVENFFGRKYLTSNMYFPKLCEIKSAIHDCLTSEFAIIRTMASNMLMKFDNYWNVIQDTLGVAVVLDPRYKIYLAEFYFPKFYGSEAMNEVNKIRKLLCDLLLDYQSRNNSEKSQECKTSVCLDKNKDGTVGLSDLDLFMLNKEKTRTKCIRAELDDYLEEDLLPRTNDFDILLWWKIHGARFPTLRAIAADFLAIPVFSAPPKSVFHPNGHTSLSKPS